VLQLSMTITVSFCLYSCCS